MWVPERSNKPPRPDALVGTPLLIKEGKLLIYVTINFSSFLRRSTHAEGGWEVVNSFKNLD
jgi:hypothetical protein